MTSKHRQNIGYWLLLWVIFGVLPICLAYAGLETFLAMNARNQLDKREEDLRRSLNALRQTAKKESFLYCLLKKECTILNKSPNVYDEASKLSDRLSKRYPGLFSFLIVDTSGKKVSGDVAPTEHLLIKTLFESAREFRSNGNFEKLVLLFREKGDALKTFLGDKTTLNTFISQEFFQEVIRVDTGEEKAFFFHHCSPGLGFFCWIRDAPLAEKESLGDILETFNQENPDLNFGLITDSKKSSTKGPEPNYLEACRAEYRTTFKTTYLLASNLLLLQPIGPNRLLWGFTKLSHSWALQAFRGSFLVFGFLFLLATGIPSYRIIVSAQSPFISIRWKLVALLTFSSGIPLLVLWFTGIEYFFEKQRNLTAQVSRNLLSHLRTIDENVRSVNMRNLSRIREILPKFGNPDEIPVEKIWEKIIFAYPDLRFQDALIVDAQGNKIFSSVKGGKGREKYGILARLVSRGLQKYDHSLDADTQTDGEGSQDTLFSKLLFNRLGEIQLFSMGGTKQFIFVDLLKNSVGSAGRAIVVTWGAGEIFQDFLAETISKFEGKEGITLAISESNPLLSVPLKEMNRSWIPDFSAGLRRSQSQETQIIEDGGEKFIAVGLLGKEISDFQLIETYPLENIQRDIRKEELRLATFGLFSFILAVLMAFSFSKNLLIPVRTLSEGVAAIEARNFDYSITQVTNDEFGTVAKTFNLMMEGLKELSLAHTLQESLFPANALMKPGLAVYGNCSTFSELGGDYFDYFPVGENQVHVIIGDVSGHGIRSSLLMTMAKAVVWREAKHGTSPGKVLDILNLMIRETVGDKFFLSMFYASIDIATWQMRFALAGHPYPILVLKDGTCKEIQSPNVPLGKKRKGGYFEGEMALPEKSRLFLYTDGIPEGRNSKGVQMGYTVWTNILRKCPCMVVEEQYKRILAQAIAWRENTPQEDDVTLIVIQRN